MKRKLKPGYSRYSVTRYTLTGVEKCPSVRSIHMEELILKDKDIRELNSDQKYKKLKSKDPCEQTFIKADRMIVAGKKKLNFDIGASINCIYTFLFLKI